MTVPRKTALDSGETNNNRSPEVHFRQGREGPSTFKVLAALYPTEGNYLPASYGDTNEDKVKLAAEKQRQIISMV
jgi:hypothetical protein